MKQVQSQPEEEFLNENVSPMFGRLLIVLLFAVALIVVITFASEAYYSN